MRARQLGACAEWKGPLIGDMPAGYVAHDRTTHVPRRLPEKYIERAWRRIALFAAIGEGAEAESGDARERAREDELAQHAVDAIERLVHILEHENRAVELRGIRSAEEGADECEVPALERAGGAAFLQPG